MNKLINIILIIMATVIMIGCSEYTAEKQPADTFIPNSSIISVELEDSHHLLPNQEAIVTLSVNKIGDLKISDTFISGIAVTDLDTQRASIKTISITFEANGKQQTIDIDGYIANSDGKLGIPIGCGNDDINKCGVLEFINTDGWSIATSGRIDISNIHIMVDRS